ncbi:hypothetical protein DBR47_22740 [Paucibacter sp. KBW04]|uniref:hypothetical protein n=1 Tax=Paucibacter sp. KBW04 TaxID=2153361 RepID=UPI000F57EAFF|nr:hypothetical protein [Paucibacter sp. KBW04]RQO54466.1 hypothetical protein DBR47_22740 [Paucibacter sp. KBW04]
MKRLAIATTGILLAATAFAAGHIAAVTSRGLGPVQFGMTVAQFSHSVGEALSEPQNPEDSGCFYLESKRFNGVSFMFEDGKLRRIDVRTDKISTQDGIRIGTTVAAVKRRYGRRLSDEPHHYSGPEDRYLTVALAGDIAVRFETRDAKVDNFYIGNKAQVQYVEGCL